LHALLLGLAARQGSAPARVLPWLAPPPVEVQVETAPEAVAAASDPPGAAAVMPPGHAAATARAGRTALPDDAVEPSETAAPPPGLLGEPATAPSPAASAAVTPRLSLAQLGVAGDNSFLDRADPAVARAAKAARVQQRLDRALAQGLTNADSERGHGRDGPVLRSLEAAVYASTAPLNGNASFVFVIDGEGTLLSTTLGDATGDRTAWLRAARRAAQSLASKKRADRKGRSVRLTVAVSSHLELPSGADPGLEISAQGLPIKKGEGPRSTRLDFSIFPFPAATLAGDPADIGARARRMVHAQVVSEELL